MAVAAITSGYRRNRPVSRDNVWSVTPNVEKVGVTINTGGKIFQTCEHTLNRFPNTLLGCPEKRKNYFDSTKKQYFFDRHRSSFTAILYYYQSGGVLERPINVPPRVFMEEVTFFQLSDETQKKNGENAGGKPYENAVSINPDDDVPQNSLARYIYLLFEQPTSSMPARCLAIFSLLIIVLSIVVFCVETLPQLRNPRTREVFFGLNAACSSWFTLEFLLRFLVSTNKLKFARAFLNVLDLLSILPFYVTLSVEEKAGGIAILRVMRVIRVCRIFKLTRHSKGLHILGKTLVASMNELIMLSLFLVIGVVVFASAAYYAEESVNKGFASIPHAFWWAVVTMTTVGYGDVVPETVIGKCIGALCALSGVLAIALPVPVIVSNFEYFYKTELGDPKSEDLQEVVSLKQLDNLVIKSPFLERRVCQEKAARTRRSLSLDSIKVCELVPLALPQTNIKNGSMVTARQPGGRHSRGTSPMLNKPQHQKRSGVLISEAIL